MAFVLSTGDGRFTPSCARLSSACRCMPLRKWHAQRSPPPWRMPPLLVHQAVRRVNTFGDDFPVPSVCPEHFASSIPALSQRRVGPSVEKHTPCTRPGCFWGIHSSFLTKGRARAAVPSLLLPDLRACRGPCRFWPGAALSLAQGHHLVFSGHSARGQSYLGEKSDPFSTYA